MRSLLVAITFLIVLFPLCPILGIEHIVKKISPKKCYGSSFIMARGILRFVCFLSGAKIEVIGAENVPKDRPVLFISNHRSYFDIFTTYSVSQVQMGYIAKESIAKIPMVKPWMLNMNCLFLNRDDAREGLKTIKDGIAKIEEGTSMCIFPEGHATPTDTMLPFKDGSFKLATRSKCPIVPMTITGTENLFELHMPWIKKSKVTIMYSEPIETADMDRKEQKLLAERVQGIIVQNLRDLAIRDGREPVDVPIDPDLWEKYHPPKDEQVKEP